MKRILSFAAALVVACVGMVPEASAQEADAVSTTTNGDQCKLEPSRN